MGVVLGSSKRKLTMNLDAPGVPGSPSRRPPPPRIWRAPACAFLMAKSSLLPTFLSEEEEGTLLMWFPAEALLAFAAAELLTEAYLFLSRQHRLKTWLEWGKTEKKSGKRERKSFKKGVFHKKLISQNYLCCLMF